MIRTYVADYQGFFKSSTRSSYSNALEYLSGLFKCEKKKATCTGIGDTLPNLCSQNLNHMLSDSFWDYQDVMDAVAARTNRFFRRDLGAPEGEVGLLIDEVGFRKWGNNSACVSRQWLGCLGKQDNGQVAVGGVLSYQGHYSLINQRLFMPEKWANDPKRRKKAGIPEELTFKTKPQIALEMIKKAKQDGIVFGWVGFDALYGTCYSLLDELGNLGITFTGEIRTNTQFYLEEPQLGLPEQKGKGRKPKNLKIITPAIGAEAYFKQLQDKDWELVTFREGVKSDMMAWFHRKTVWVWNEEKKVSSKYVLLIRKEIDGSDIKYSFTNDHKASLKRLAFRQGQRFFVEKTYKEGKNQIGMGDYQIRSWKGFHRHIALCMLGLNFMMEQKAEIQPLLPYITAEDIRGIIAFLLPNKYNTVDEKILGVLEKHDKYQAQIENDRQRTNRKRPESLKK